MARDWMPNDDEWPQMSSDHLEETRQAAHAEIVDVQTQLGDNNREVGGRRLTCEEHNEWRQSAKFALKKKREVYTRLLAYIKQRNLLGQQVERDKRAIAAALIAQEASAKTILAMSPDLRIALVRKCNEAAVLLAECRDA